MRYAPKIALALASLVIGIALCELALSFLHPQLFRRPPVWRYDPELGWSHIPDRRRPLGHSGIRRGNADQ